ncbi:hypothetical protein BT67DRAFT_438180 [Trichocladium antarcticum]|uniref:Uncharacterized protein n=1 Tax=Trichocladium antarcticum TaxID=1450529 RepID=A0AAN6UTY5_9PEZI|nr:hypothetical protein BT67DRAFT_438180 [Trichocladium antarcticum]
MFTITPTTPPAFSFGHQSSRHRPNISSPLSSSPIRATNPSPPPCAHSTPFPSLQRHHSRQRDTQSSPITRQPSIFSPSHSPSHSHSHNHSHSGGNNSISNSANSANSTSSSKSRFATRNTRPNPVLRRREDLQESRRRLFLQNVRLRGEEKRWEMRGGEDELLKLEWWRLNRERQQANEAEAALYLAMERDLEAEEEELRRAAWEQQQQRPSSSSSSSWGGGEDVDAMMADAIAREEEAEMDALVSGLEEDDWEAQRRRRLPGSPHFSDDDDYDGLFLHLISQQDGQAARHSQDVEMT